MQLSLFVSRVIIKRVGSFNKETSGKIVIVNYIKVNVSTSTEIVYTGRNRCSVEIIQFLYPLTNCPRQHVRLFISTKLEFICNSG